jgi:ABC-type uncharacterized transport system substrate-binding protein
MQPKNKKMGCILFVAGLLLCFLGLAHAGSGAKKPYAGKRILHIDSYHEGYEWSDGIVNGIQSILKNTGVEIKVHRMDTKRNPSEDFKKEAALKAKTVIEQFRPHVTIVSDDNASKYLVMPYYRNGNLPFVFCGVNWDASKYGYPYKNATGMVEMDPMEEMLRYFDRFAGGRNIAYISGDTYSDSIIAKNLSCRFLDGKMSIYMVKTFSEYKAVCLKAQKENDALILNNNVGIPDWNQEEAVRFAEEQLTVPTSTTNPWMVELTLFAMAKLPEEQGAWAAKTALRILDGVSPSEIPLAYNTMAVLTINMRIAKKIGVLFDLSDLQRARIIR